LAEAAVAAAFPAAVSLAAASPVEEGNSYHRPVASPAEELSYHQQAVASPDWERS